MARVNIGCSGFNYNHWRGNFYPEKLPQRLWFSHYFSVFSTVELNVTFYRLPQFSVFEHWREQTPADFAFVIKGSRFITHIKKLNGVEEPIQRYFDAAQGLGDKLRVVLWQLPPNFSLDLERFRQFLALLDRYPVRSAFEFRHESWFTNEVVELCQAHNVAFCLADWPQYLYEWEPTADFIYLRRHGHGGTTQPVTAKRSWFMMRKESVVIFEPEGMFLSITIMMPLALLLKNALRLANCYKSS